MVAKPLCPLYKNIIKPLDRARYPELRSIFLIFIELAKISSFVQQSTRLKGTFCKKMQQASTSIGAKEMYTS